MYIVFKFRWFQIPDKYMYNNLLPLLIIISFFFLAKLETDIKVFLQVGIIRVIINYSM